MGRMALVSTRTWKPRSSALSMISMISGFMKGSPPVMPISVVGRPEAAISSR
jgi:hypothetical protein